MDGPVLYLLLNLCVAFYNVGTIWAMEIDIFRTWRLVGKKEFHEVQDVHWRKLPYWIFTPVALGFLGGIGLVWYHPAGSPVWSIWGSLAAQFASLALTAIFWWQWQAKLSTDPAGPKSDYLRKILRTHWIRTALITVYATVLLALTITVLT